MPAYFNDDLHTLIYKFSKAAGQAQAGPTYDPDAEAFFEKVFLGSGYIIGDPEKQKINQRILDLKSWGEWDFLLQEWYFMSAFNAGTGSVVYGIKPGNNASLNLGPTWASNSVRINSDVDTGAYIGLFPLHLFSTGVYIYSVHSVDSVTSPNRGIDLSGTIEGGMWAPFSDSNIYWDCLDSAAGRCSGNSDAINGQTNLWAGSSLGTNAWVNKISKASGGTFSSQSDPRVGKFGQTGLGSSFFVGNIYAAGVFDTMGFNQSMHEANYNSLASTVLQGIITS